jgi:aminoglycoside/choline kinase family phosphotransferase
MEERSSQPEAVAADARYQALTAWVNAQLAGRLASAAPQEWQLRSLTGDAGFRRYFRLQGSAHQPISLLAVDAPPATEDTAQFVALAQYLRHHGVRTPTVFAADAEQGFLLVEDFGARLLQSELTAETATTTYGAALMTLLALQQAPDNPTLIPRYDQPLLRVELELFSEWFVTQLLGHQLTATERALLAAVYEKLEQSALEQPQVLVHRDYHSRNLLLCNTGALGVIDFQGALWGPCTYDPVSLLRDCYLRWPETDVRRWAISYGNMAMDAGILPPVNEQTYLRWFDWMGLQRHIKVLGIFARLHLRDNKPHYLADLPRVISYLLDVAEAYPELEDFAQWFRTRILPVAEQQAWYAAGAAQVAALRQEGVPA